MGDGSPILSDLSSLKKILIKALTKKQVLLLKEVENNSTKTITSLINKLSRTSKIPLSTLKLNARMLKHLGLIEYTNSNPVVISEAGRIVLKLVEGND